MALGLLGDIFGGIGSGLKAVGHGFNTVMDQGVNNSLAAIGVDPSMLTPQQKSALRSQFLMQLGQAIQPGGNVPQAQQNFQMGAAGLMQQQQAQKLRAAIAQIEATTSDPVARYRAIGDLYSRMGAVDKAQEYYKAAKEATPAADEAIGSPFEAVVGGKPGMFQRFKSGKVQQLGLGDGGNLTAPVNYVQTDTGGQIQWRDPRNPSAPPVATTQKTAPPSKPTYSRELFAWWAAGNGTPQEQASGKSALAALNTPGYSKGEMAYRSQTDPDPAQRKIWKAAFDMTVKSEKDNGGVALPPPPPMGMSVERNEEWLKQLPVTEQNIVKAMVEGRYPVPQGRALQSPEMQRLIQAAATYEPGFDLTQWSTRLAIRKDIATGKSAENTRRLNTLIHHAGRLVDAINGLNNWGWKPINWLGNTLKSNTVGNPEMAQFGFDSSAMFGEAASLFKGTGATDQEIAGLREHMNKNAPLVEQLTGAKEVINLAFGRLAAQEEQFRNAFHKPRDYEFLAPDSRKILREKLGMNPDELDPVGAARAAAPAAAPPTLVPNVTRVNGWLYLGGDPNNRNSWRQ